MSINLRCPECHKAYSLKTTKCKCGNNLKTNRRFKVTVKLPTGRWKSKTVDTLDMAKKVEAKYKTQAVEQDVFDIKPKAPVIDSAWDKYLKWAKLNKRTWKNDQYLWNQHIRPYLHGLRMDQVKPHHVLTIINNMQTKTKDNGKPYALATIKHAVILIKHVFNWSIRQGLYFKANPCNSIVLPRFDNQATNPLSRDGLKALMTVLETWPNERAVLFIKFALYSGKKRGEILKMTWDNVDLENRLLTLQATNTKSKKTQTVPLNDLSMDIICRCKELQLSELVFPSSTGQYFKSFDTAWKRIRKRAGLQGFRFHDLRHTYASYLASSGKVDIYTLKELLGHSDIKMTQRYAHLINGALRKAAHVADEVF